MIMESKVFTPQRQLPFADAEKLILDELNAWVPDLYFMPLWRTIGTKPDSVNLLYGWAVENFHYTGAVQQHIVTALGRDGVLVDGLTRRLLVHMSEEWDHPQLFLAAARAIAEACGSDEDPGQSRPLGATRALIHWLRQAGRIDPLVYKTCAATLERTAVRLDETRVFYHHVARTLNLPTSAVAPFIAHAETDEAYEHLNALGEFREDIDVVDQELVDTALRAARGFVDLYSVWQAKLVAHYRQFPPGRGARR